ncbi:MAG: glutamate-5-semialdehyde dehydrogenase [Elusimicrobiota bacterium]
MNENSTGREKQEEIFNMGLKALRASRKLREISSEDKRKALNKIADLLESKIDDIKFRNEIDVEAAREDGLSESLIDRLVLDEKRIRSMIKGVRDVAGFEDPVGTIIEKRKTDAGLEIEKVRVPLGVVAMIYESRPNVTADAAALCLMSSNAVILRGGTEALNSNLAIGHYIREALKQTSVPEDAVYVLDDTDRNLVDYLVSLKGIVDVVIPRGSEKMISQISKKSLVPVIGHGKGLCHIYIDKKADVDMAVKIVHNAKVQRPGVCNAVETLIVHADCSSRILPAVCRKLSSSGVELRGDEKARKIYSMKEASKDDWSSEYLNLTLSIKVVDSIDEAIEHIESYGSGHSDAIVSDDLKARDKFFALVDSACVYHNASTRFTDGAQMGMGAEIGISNQKLHARGPMGVKEMTTYKYRMSGKGLIRE